MGKIVSDFEQITSQTAFWNGLCSKTEVWLYSRSRCTASRFGVSPFIITEQKV